MEKAIRLQGGYIGDHSHTEDAEGVTLVTLLDEDNLDEITIQHTINTLEVIEDLASTARHAIKQAYIDLEDFRTHLAKADYFISKLEEVTKEL